jgi:hypothetical protein
VEARKKGGVPCPAPVRCASADSPFECDTKLPVECVKQFLDIRRPSRPQLAGNLAFHGISRIEQVLSSPLSSMIKHEELSI